MLFGIIWYYLINTWSCNPDSQAPASNGWNDFTCGHTAQDQPAGWHVLLHGTTKSMLGILCQLINLSQENNWMEKVRLVQLFVNFDNFCWYQTSQCFKYSLHKTSSETAYNFVQINYLYSDSKGVNNHFGLIIKIFQTHTFKIFLWRIQIICLCHGLD